MDIENFFVFIELGVFSGLFCNMVCFYKDVNVWVMCDDGCWSDYYIKCNKELFNLLIFIYILEFILLLIYDILEFKGKEGGIIMK